MHDLALIARAAGVSQADLLVLAPANDPFALHQPARQGNAEWFAELFARFNFGQGVHIRRIHYRIVSQDPPMQRPDGGDYLNTTSDWKLLVNASRDARYLGLVPVDAFVDRRNPDPSIFFEAMTDGTAQLSNSGLWLAEPNPDFPELPSIEFYGAQYGPPVLVEIWCEKTTMNDVLLPVARRYGVNLVTGAGEMSETSVRLFLDRAMAAGVPSRILYVSDFDPAGRSMPVAVARKIEFAGQNLDVTLDPVVLTEAQCRDYRLPRTPIKKSEKRGAKFEQRFGAGATELDALEALHPGELGQIVSREIERYIDPDHERAFNVAEQDYREQLRHISTAFQELYRDEIDELELEYSDFLERFSGFRERAELVFERIADHLSKFEHPTFVSPSPRPRDDTAAPMFDARRDYFDPDHSLPPMAGSVERSGRRLMGRDKRNENREEQFTKWVRPHRLLPAWRALGFPAREVYFHLQVRCFAETAQKNPKVFNNNGEVYRSPRDLARDMGCNAKTAMAALADLQAKGWIFCTRQGHLGSDGRGKTARFRLTMLPTGQGNSHKPPTREPHRWQEGNDFEVVAYSASKPKGRKGDVSKLKKQKPAPVCGASLNQFVVQHRQKTPGPAPVCGAENAVLGPVPAPDCGAYLITISPKKLLANHIKGLGLCGNA